VDLGWFAVRTHPSFRVGNSWPGIESLGWEATVKDYGVAVGDAAGVKPGASPVNRTSVNVGSACDRSWASSAGQRWQAGIGATPAEGMGETEPL
jgi:hypothetical protein